MLVYRVEQQDGHGPYQWHHKYANEIASAHQGDQQRPGGTRDGLTWRSERRYGFTTLELLHQWFDGWMKKLREVGYRISIYEVPATQVQSGESELQCTFTAMHAVCVGYADDSYLPAGLRVPAAYLERG